tara:strand:- start:51 stop:737 length:687 start_codon:yes stop_codon:yes gene_type:complete
MFSFFKKKDVKSEIYVDELIKHQINPAINRRGKKIISEALLKSFCNGYIKRYLQTLYSANYSNKINYNEEDKYLVQAYERIFGTKVGEKIYTSSYINIPPLSDDYWKGEAVAEEEFQYYPENDFDIKKHKGLYNFFINYKKLTHSVPNKYWVSGLIGPPIIFGLINQSFKIGLLTLVIGFVATFVFLRILNIIGGEKISRHVLGPKMNLAVMVAVYIWVGIYLPKFIS